MNNGVLPISTDHPESVVHKPKDPYTILIVDDEKLVRMVAKRRLTSLGHRLLEATDGQEALELIRRESVDLVLSDWIMNKLDGPGLCRAIKSDERFRNIHFIFMTSLDKPAQIAEGLSLGADDFLPKSASEQEIIARVNAGLRARQLLLDLAESYGLLSEKQAQLNAELQSAADYVRSLLPQSGNVIPELRLDWIFLPSSQLGGDLFQVGKWGRDHVGMMILDMSGHGIGPALRAVSLAGLFKGDHFRSSIGSFDPGQIVSVLNQENPMTEQGEYFTIWVGVFQRSTQTLRFATAGHPGGVLVRSNGNSLVLGARTWPIGFMPNESYATHSLTLQSGDCLYLFSDGVFEVMNPIGDIWGVERLRMAMEKNAGRSISVGLKEIIQESQRWQGHATFGDDVALVGLEFLLEPRNRRVPLQQKRQQVHDI